jgi:hypothetical protein
MKAVQQIRRIGGLLCLLGILFLGFRAGLLLSRDPCLGVADNLDYWRVARPAGIQVAPQKRPGLHVVCSYPVGDARLASAFSSPALIAWLGRHLGWGLGVPPGRFDLRQVGLLYGLLSLLLLVGALILRLPIALALFFTWVVTDPGFLLFFNSLYADPALIVGLLGVATLIPAGSFELVREEPGARRHRFLLALLAGLAAMASFSKMQFSPFALVLAVSYGLAALAARRRPTAIQASFLIALGVAGAAGGAHFLWGSGPRFPNANNYNAVYGGIARVASDPGATLERLGIPPERRSQSTEDYFAAGVSADDPVVQAIRPLSRLRLAWTYLVDPGALLRTAAAIEDIFQRVKAHPRGNYTQDEGAGIYQTPEQYSLWRARLLGSLPSSFLWMVLAAVLLALGVRGVRRSWSPMCTLLLFLMLWVVSQMAVAVLGEGFVNLHQHLVGARLGFDLILVTLVFLVGQAAIRRLTARAPEARSGEA